MSCRIIWIFGFYDTGISWAGEWLVASQEGFFSMELVWLGYYSTGCGLCPIWGLCISYAEPLTATNTVVVMHPDFINVFILFLSQNVKIRLCAELYFRLGFGTKLWTLLWVRELHATSPTFLPLHLRSSTLLLDDNHTWNVAIQVYGLQVFILQA